MHEKVGINAKQCCTRTLLSREHQSDSIGGKSCQGVATLVPTQTLRLTCYITTFRVTFKEL